MARIRYIKPTFPEDEKLAPAVSRDARLFYILSWCWMDKQGLLEHAPRVLKRNIFPYDDDITTATIESMIDELKDVKRFFSLEWQGVRLLYCPTMRRHQKFHRGEGFKYGIPEEILAALINPPDPGAVPVPFKHPTSTIQAPGLHHTGIVPAADEPPSSSAGNWNGELGTGIRIGIGIGNGELATGNGELGTGNGQQPAVDPEIRTLNEKFLALKRRLAGGGTLKPMFGGSS